ncbi:hypothetical protein H0R90_08330 [Treponema putidum]|uniref:Replication restart DNA helicase PriA n=1 Tax=Treponema putidum TaxID=221027 RepID=A0AAE9SHD6_9SPIR|nr:hypothetical protein [Treponema putidum]AIN94102.1 hypothetical protein JO40_08295 [Treponema putidum]TWI77070.1 hypothetical protein JM98_01635 [Treponema putidum]UTY32955.1 hypothetical protein E4N74_02245 [Treponema putidum]
MSIENYKCPSCGAPISFDPKTGGFKCGYCFSSYTEEELTKYMEGLKEKKEGYEENSSSETGESSGDGKIKQYHCNNCGAEVVVGDTSSTAFCYYCHSPVVLSDRLKGDFKPDKIIPFKIDKKEALKHFASWVKGKSYVPADFTSTGTQEKMTGIYLPHWQADVTADVDYHATGLKISTTRSGNTEYTKTDKYKIDRTGKIELDKFQELAFTKIDKTLINAISPYDLKNQKDFSQGYLAGFSSEQYDIKKEDIEPIIKGRAEDYTKGLIQDSTDYGGSIEDEQDNTSYTVKNYNYVLLPSWILTYLYKGKTYVFAVNGETGKATGELPVNKSKLALVSGIISGILAALLLLGGRFIW